MFPGDVFCLLRMYVEISITDTVHIYQLDACYREYTWGTIHSSYNSNAGLLLTWGEIRATAFCCIVHTVRSKEICTYILYKGTIFHKTNARQIPYCCKFHLNNKMQ
jgi:hypothetical protein